MTARIITLAEYRAETPARPLPKEEQDFHQLFTAASDLRRLVPSLSPDELAVMDWTALRNWFQQELSKEVFSRKLFQRSVLVSICFVADLLLSYTRGEHGDVGIEEHLDRYEASGVEEIEWLAYRDGRSGDRHHERMHGKRVKLGEHFTLPSGARMLYPGDSDGPIGDLANCFPGDTRLMARGAARIFRRWYSGDLVEITTGRGHKISGTPNHPILTSKGWVPISALDEGCHVFSCGNSEALRGARGNDHDTPSSFEEIFRLASRGGTAVLAGSDLDFHGDGAVREIDVVSIDGELRRRLDAKVAQHRGELRFAAPGLTECALGVPGAQPEFVGGPTLPANSGMGGGRETLPLLGRGLRHSEDHRLGAGASLDAGHFQAGLNSRSGDTQALSDGLHADSAFEETHDGFDRDLWSLHAPDIVVSKTVHQWAGHVFNLSTQSGSYSGNGIICHNCRCTSRAVYRSTKQRRG
jgi:hypothetical protein